MPRTALPLVLIHLSCYLGGVTTGSFHTTIGVDDFGTGDTEFTELFHANAHEFRNNSTGATASFGANEGMVIGVRSATEDQILDPTAVVFASTASAAPAANLAADLFVLALNRSGAPTSFCGDRVSLISAGAELSLAECIAFRDIVNTFQTALGRNV